MKVNLNNMLNNPEWDISVVMWGVEPVTLQSQTLL